MHDREVLDQSVADNITGVKAVRERKESLSVPSPFVESLPGPFSVLRGTDRSGDLGRPDVAASRIALGRHAGLASLNRVTEQQQGKPHASHHRLIFPPHTHSHPSIADGRLPLKDVRVV